MKTKLIFILSFSLLIFSFLFNSCGSHKLAPNVCFNKNILPIFISKCTTSGCHSGGRGHEEGRSNFTTYEGIMNAVTPYHPLLSEVYTKCRGSNPEMPPSRYQALTTEELATIEYWIHIGAKNSDCGVSVCDTMNFTYSSKVQPLFSLYCTGCHNTSNPQGGYDMSTYNGVKAAITPSNRLSGCINWATGYSTMPKGGSKLDACDIKALQKWIDAGYLNN